MTSHEASEYAFSTTRSSTEELRVELCRLIDEIVAAKSDRAPMLVKRFDEHWRQLTEAQAHTVH